MFKHTEKLLLKHTVINMAFIKVEGEDMKIEEHEDTETQADMVFIIEESEDIRIEEAFRVKHEDTEEQTGRFHLSSVILCHESLLFVSLFLLSLFFFTESLWDHGGGKNIRSKEKLYNNRLQRAPTAWCCYTSQRITTPCLISAKLHLIQMFT